MELNLHYSWHCSGRPHLNGWSYLWECWPFGESHARCHQVIFSSSTWFTVPLYPGFYHQSSSCLLYPQVNWTPALPESRSSLTAPLFKTISLLNIYQDHQLYSSMIKNGRAYLQAMKLLVIYLPWHCHGKFCCNTMCLKNKSLCDSFKIVVCVVAASCWQGITMPNCRKTSMICILCVNSCQESSSRALSWGVHL